MLRFEQSISMDEFYSDNKDSFDDIAEEIDDYEL